MAQADLLVETWKRKFGLRGWTIIRLPRADRPFPAKTSAFSEVDFAQRQAKVWATTEAEVIHELLHILLSALDDAFWRANAPKALRSLYARREESVVMRLEKTLRREA
jgi:hypothetical protein